jgi:Glycosyl hydrolase catalytic core
MPVAAKNCRYGIAQSHYVTYNFEKIRREGGRRIKFLTKVLRAAALGAALAAIAVASREFQTPGRVQAPPLGPGVAIGYGGDGHDLGILGSVWYLDYNFAPPSWPDHRRLYFVQIKESPQKVAQVAKRFPGEWWTFGNEPNDPNQDNIQPKDYVQPYHDLYYALKTADPQARLVPTGVANADWRWLEQWREDYRQRYGRYPPADGWRFHNYLLDTCAGALIAGEFKRRALEFQDWVKSIGDGTRPIFLTEYGVLYGNGCCNCPVIPPDAVVDYMRTTTRWLIESHVVTAWAWFALDSGNRFNGDLFRDGRILPAGTAYQELKSEWNASR